MTEQAATIPGDRRFQRMTQEALAVWRRLPFTTTVVVAMLLAGLATGALWRPLVDQPWFPDVAFGLPSFVDGRWWTLVTGAFFALTPWFYLPMAGSFALFVGWAEYHIGTRLTAAVTIIGQLLAVLGASLFLLVVQTPAWPWSTQTATQLDVGFSAGALTVAAVASAMLRPPWRLRVRLVLGIYALVAAFYTGTPADLEHFLAVAIGLAAGPRITRGLDPPASGRPSRREWRLLAVAGLLMVAVTSVVTYFVPDDGPLGPNAGDAQDIVDLAITLIFVLLLITGLRRGKRLAWWFTVVIAGLNVFLGVVIAVIGVLVAIFGGGDLDIDNGLPRFAADKLLWTAVFVILLVGRRAFRVPSRRRVRRSTATTAIDQPTAVQMLQKSGGGTLSWMATWPENTWFRTPDGESFVAYQRHTGVAIGLGDPVGPDADRGEAVRAFATVCERSGWVPCLFSATEETADAAGALGWQRVQVAEDTIVDLPDLQFRGKSWQDVRSALNKAGKQGITFRMVTLAEERWSLVAQVRAISEEWVGDKALPEMGFTLGGVDEALDPHVRVGLAESADGQLQGVTSWLPVYGSDGQVRGWTLDVMRRRHDGFRPVVEFLIASSCLTFQSEGAQFLSLSGAPLARAKGEEATAALDRLLDTLGEVLEPMYGFRSLHVFKNKFAPRYEPMYLVFRDEADLPRIGIALTRAYLPDTPLHEIVRMGRGN